MASENVVALASHPKVLPIGSVARHTEHGVVDIISRSGDRRLVRWYEHEVLPLPDDDPDVLLNETICELDAWVEVNELREMAPHRDIDRELTKAYYDGRRAGQYEVANHHPR